MGIVNSGPTITCDCCGYAIGSGTYAGVFRNTAAGVNTTRVFCNAKGCDAKLLGVLSAADSTEVTRHTTLIVSGVIPTHPA